MRIMERLTHRIGRRTPQATRGRRVQIVRYGKELLSLQLTVLVAGVLVLATALADGWGAAVLTVASLVAMACAVAQVARIRRHGLAVWIEEASEAAPKPAPLSEAMEQVPSRPIAAAMRPPAQRPEEPHWTELAYPDPDEELGLTPSPRPQGSAESFHWSEQTFPDPDDDRAE